MNWWKVLVYLVLAAGALLVLNVVASMILGLLTIIWAILTTAATLLAVGGLLYGSYKLVSWIRNTGSEQSRTREPATVHGDATTNVESKVRVEELKDQYASGALSEAELERQLESELESQRIDREVHRERR